MSLLLLHQDKKCIKNSDCSLYEVCRVGICEPKKRADDCVHSRSYGNEQPNYCNYRNSSSQNLECDPTTHTCVIKGSSQHGGDCTKDPFCHFTKFCNDGHVCEERVGLGRICNRNSHASIKNIYGNCRRPYICAPGCYGQSSSATDECCVLPCFDDQDCKMLGRHCQCVQLPASHPNSNFFGYCQESILDDCESIKRQPRTTWPVDLSCKYHDRFTHSCTLDSDCKGQNEICKKQRCVKRVMGDRCQEDSDCTASLICHRTNKRCLQSTYYLSSQILTCLTENDCRFDYDCVNGTCVPKGNEGDRCDDILCNDPFVCDRGVCYFPYHSDPLECFLNRSYKVTKTIAIPLPDISTPAYLGICDRTNTSVSTRTHFSISLSHNAWIFIILYSVLLFFLIISIIVSIWRNRKFLKRLFSFMGVGKGQRAASEPSIERDVLQSSMTFPSGNSKIADAKINDLINNNSDPLDQPPPWTPSEIASYYSQEDESKSIAKSNGTIV